MNQQIQENFAATAMAAMVAAGEANMVGATPYVLVPAGYSLRDVETMLPQPTRKRGTAVLHTVESLIAYVNRHSDDRTQIYVDSRTNKTVNVVAVLDDDAEGSDEAQWREHRAQFSPPLSLEWQTWRDWDKKPMSQEDFANFLTQREDDIAKPDKGVFNEIVNTMSAKKDAQYKGGVKLASGSNSFSYTETVNGVAGIEGNIAIPEEILLGVPVFQGGIPYGFPAKFRYKLKGGVLSLWYELVNPHKVLETAVRGLIDAIQAPVTQPDPSLVPPTPSFDGSTPSAPFAPGTGIRVLHGTPAAT